ncbi:PAS domain S-box protein [Haloarchaeobius sp. TZWWS8]|uniref:PAS domain S-box protein n=1 Tax=Haloarchaeobius sp. TZWWS8 TaxID=3446121 RepID=UPI003EBD1C5E
MDDDSSFARLTPEFLPREDESITVTTAESAREGLAVLKHESIDCVVSDYDMPEQNGIEFLQSVRERYPGLPFVLFTGKGSEEIASEAISAGVTDYLQKHGGKDQFTLLANRIGNAVANQRAQTNYREIFEKATDGIVVHDIETSLVVDANTQFCKMLGYTSTELIGKTIGAISTGEPPYTDERAAELIKTAAAEGPQVFEWRTLSKDGTEVPVEVHLKATSIGGQGRVLAVVRNITERKAREAELRVQRERFDQLVRRVDEYALFVLDPDGTVASWNDGAERLKGYTESEILGQHLSVFYPDDVAAERPDEILARAAEVGNVQDEGWRVRKDGTRFWARVSVTPLYDDDGDVRGFSKVTQDLTERRRHQRELEAQNERLEEFAVAVSHDLRNPLNVAQSRLKMAQTDRQSDDLDDVEWALDRMRVLIDDMLALARQRDHTVSLEPVSLRNIVAGCWRNVETGEARLILDCDRELLADAGRLKQLFENLIRNAVEHSSSDYQTESPAADGGAPLTIRVGCLDGGFSLEDSGFGIPAADRDRVFESGYSTNEAGTGLGLAIVHDVATAHGWEVAVTEGTEGGARFEFRGVERV